MAADSYVENEKAFNRAYRRLGRSTNWPLLLNDGTRIVYAFEAYAVNVRCACAYATFAYRSQYVAMMRAIDARINELIAKLYLAAGVRDKHSQSSVSFRVVWSTRCSI